MTVVSQVATEHLEERPSGDAGVTTTDTPAPLSAPAYDQLIASFVAID